MTARILLALVILSVPSTAAEPLKILFLGDNAGHQPKARFAQLQPVLKARGIALTYTDSVGDLNAEKLNQYDGLMVFANHLDWKPENEKALLDYVRSGKGFIPIHCASYCFTKSQAYIDLVGAQFRSHTTGVFRTTTVAEHPVMKGCDSFSSWDETYVHHKHNDKGRTVLEVRTDGDLKEPWTWVREEGKGRVFYTAWGHDQRTWAHSGFHTLIERGTKWACGKALDDATVYIDRPKMTKIENAKPFEYVPARLPHYVGSHKLGNEITVMQKPLSAADSIKHYSVPEGFEMKPFVTEEQYGGGKPICMTWDEYGRLYLALSVDYPNEKRPEGEGRDRIIICEDTDGDGVADKITPFAEKLSIPTSMLRTHGGLVVHQAPHTLFLKDTDGDGKADLKQILISGWNDFDTHAGPSNMRFGTDGWIYSMCGYSGFSGIVCSNKISFKQGLFRFKLKPGKDGLEVIGFEFLRSTSNNSWGVGFNKQGELFGSTANGCPLVHLTIPNRYYEMVQGLTPGALKDLALDNHVEAVVKDYRQVDFHGGFTAAAGCTPYTGGLYSSQYDNVIFICEPTAHLVAAMKIEPHGSSYIARYGWNLCASDDDWAAPIDAQVGPDGNVWVIDWYNIIVQHNPTPAGFKNGKGNAYEIDLRDKKYGRVYRIVDKNAKPQPKVDFDKAIGDKSLVNHPNHFWQMQYWRAYHENPAGFGGIGNLNTIEQRFQSTEPAMRLKALLALADDPIYPGAENWLQMALMTPENLNDPAIRDAIVIAGAVHSQELLSLLVVTRMKSAEALPLVSLIARNYHGNLNRLMVTLPVASNFPVRDAVIDGLAQGRFGKPELNESAKRSIGEMIVSLKGPAQGKFLKFALALGVQGLDAQFAKVVKGMAATLADAKTSDEEKLDAARLMIELQPESDDAAAGVLQAAVKADGKTAAYFELLARSKSKTIGTAIATKLKELPPTVRPAALNILLARPESTKAFLDAVEKGELRFDMLALDQKTSLSTHPDASIRERAKKILALGGGLPDADRQKVIEQFTPVLNKSGDAGLGKKAFTQHCAKCHKHGSEGTTIGPDLSGFAVHPKEEILIHLLDPSRSVEGNFKQYTARLLDGRVINGLLASQTKTSIEILDAENKRHAISRDDLEELKESPKSIMPEGFEKQMTEVELVNLMEFLTQKGKWLPIPLDKVATITSAKGMFYELDGTAERLLLKDWKAREVKGVPFVLIDPQEGKTKNVVMLHSTNGNQPPSMPKSVTLPCNTPAKAIHLLSGVSGWGFQTSKGRNTVSMIVQLRYADGSTEDHELKDGVHFADYIRRIDVKESEFAFEFQGRQQMRYLKITPKKAEAIKTIDLIKGPDRTAPVVMAVTVETP